MMVRQLFSGPDNCTVDVARVLGAYMCVAFTLLAAVYVWRGGTFSPLEMGGGMAAVLAGAGFGVRLKARAEPHPEPEPASEPAAASTPAEPAPPAPPAGAA
jgi:hypothetical protein